MIQKIFLAFLVLASLTFFSQTAHAAGTPLSGYAWSSNIGWISFASQGEGTIAYGVSLQPQSGNTRDLSGYAWNDQIGWIYFDSSLGGPAGGGDAWGARLDVPTGKFSGWARACVVFQSGCSGSLKTSTELGGWDGWIKFGDGTTYFGQVNSGFSPSTFVSNGADYNWQGNNPSNYAWGSNVVGWISMCNTAGGANSYCVKIGSMTTSCQVAYEVPAGQPGCPAATYPNGCSFVGNGDRILCHGSAPAGATPLTLLSCTGSAGGSLATTSLTYLDSQSAPYSWTPGSPPAPLAQTSTFTATDFAGQTSACVVQTTVIFSESVLPGNTGTPGLLSNPTADTIRISSQPLTSAAISSHTSFHSLETSTTTTAFIASMNSALNPSSPSLSLMSPAYRNIVTCRLDSSYLDPNSIANPSSQFSACGAVRMPLLPLSSSGNEAYFNIRVATSTPNLNRFSPYQVVISASSTCTGAPSDWSGCETVFKSFLFDYAVGTLNPI